MPEVVGEDIPPPFPEKGARDDHGSSPSIAFDFPSPLSAASCGVCGAKVRVSITPSYQACGTRPDGKTCNKDNTSQKVNPKLLDGHRDPVERRRIAHETGAGEVLWRLFPSWLIQESNDPGNRRPSRCLGMHKECQ